MQVGLGLVHRLAGALAELLHVLRDRLRGEPVAAEEHAPLDVAPARRDDQAERREDPGGPRAQNRVDPELVGDLRGVQPPGATERHQRVPPRVDAPLHGDDPQRADHLGAGDAADPLGARLDVVEAELVGEVADRFAGRLAVELDVAPEGRVRGQVAEHEVRVGDGRLGAAAPVARGAGIGARRPGPDAERPAGVPPRDRAAAGADGVDREHRQRQRTARDLAARLLLHAAAVDHAHVARRPAHVEAQGVVHAGRARDERGARGAARRSREDRPRRVAGGRLDVDQAAVRLHDRGLGEVRFTHALGEPAQIARQQRGQRRVDLGGRGPLEFAEGADDLVRERDVGLRESLGQRVADRLLVVGVAVGVEQRHRHRFGLRPGDAVGDFTCRLRP